MNVGLLNICSSSHGGVGIKFLKQFWGMKIFFINPQVVEARIYLPMYKVLEFTSTFLPFRLDDRFNFIFFFTMIDHWRWLYKRHAIGLHLFI